MRGVAVPVRAPGRGMRAALVPPLLLRPPVVPLVLLLLVLGGRWTATSSLTAEDDDDAEPEREERALHYRNQPGGGTSSSPSPEDEPEELLIAGFFPTTLNLSEGAIGRGVVPAVNLALRHINSSPHFLPGYKLDIIWNDTKVSGRRDAPTFHFPSFPIFCSLRALICFFFVLGAYESHRVEFSGSATFPVRDLLMWRLRLP